MSIDVVADRLTAAADLLTTVDRSVPGLAAPAGAFGADDAGVPGRIGRQLYAHWHASLAARSREASAAAARLTELADSLRASSREYSDTDEAAARRMDRGSMR